MPFLDPRPLPRKNLKQFLPDQRSVKAFEKVLDVTAEYTLAFNILVLGSITHINSNVTTEDLEGGYIIDCSLNSVTVTLNPEPRTGKRHIFKCKDDTYPCYISPGINLIDDSSDLIQLYKHETITVQVDEYNNWWII